MWRKLLFWKRIEIDEELDFYREMRERELRAGGLTADQARLAARRAMGNLAQVKEDARAAWMIRWLEEFGQDAAYALRSLRAAPLFTVMAVGALGMGIGFSTSLFTFYNAVALRPWAIADPGEVASVYQAEMRRNRMSYRGLEHPFFEYVRDHTASMSGVTGTKNLGHLIMERQGQRVNVLAGGTSGNYFGVMGVPMALGRPYTTADDRPGIGEPPVVLSYTFWKSELQGRVDVIGSEIRLNRAPMRVIGVAAEGFLGTSVDLIGAWIPLHSVALVQPENKFIGDENACCLDILARLKPGVSPSQAQSEMSVLADQWQKTKRRESHGMRLSSASFFSHPRVREKLGPVLALFALAVGLALMLACANVSNLLLARAAARRKEIAIRLSLGAGRFRIIRQLLTESLMLSVASASVGLGIASVLPTALMRGFAFSSELAFRFDPDRRVLAFSILLSLVTTVMFGLMPSLQATKLNLTGALKDTAAKLRRWDLRRGLAAVQVALCVVLLTGAGLLIRGLLLASQTDAGFDTRGLAVLRLDLRLFAYDQTRAVSLTQALREKLRSLPGIEGVTYVDVLPFGNNSNRSDFVPAHGLRTIEQAAIARVAPEHFETLGIPLMAGRNFTSADIGRPVAIISEATARMGWGMEDPIGKKFNRGVEVIGVARNSVYRSLESKLEATYFVPSAGGLDANFLVRLKDPRQVALVREAVRAIDPQVLPVINRLDEDMARSLQPSRMAAGIALGLGGFALALACVGLYGVIAYHVTQRTKEIGIRIALGARSNEVTGLVLSQNLRAVFAGLLIGLAGAAVLSRLLVSILYGLSPLDPVAYAGVIVCLVLAVLTASLIPARRAARMDPMTALRTE